MESKKNIAIASVILVAGVGLLGGGAVMYSKYTATTASAVPTVTYSAAPSLSVPVPVEDLAKQHPGLVKLVEDPRVASVLKDFAAAYEKGGIEGAKAFALERGFMNAAGDITLTILMDDGVDPKEMVDELKKTGVDIAGKRDNEIDVVIPAALIQSTVQSGKAPEETIRKLAATKGVRGVLPMMRHSANDPNEEKKNSDPEVKANQHQINQAKGAISEGVKLTRADKWHAAGYKGAGIKVGILDPEVSRGSEFLGDAIPADTKMFVGACKVGNTRVDDEGIHGVAAAEIVHEMAPEAQIYLACSKGDEDVSIDWLVAQGVKIISFSASGMYGPRNGSGSLQKRIDKLASQGILWVNSSGNEGKVFHRGQLTGGNENYWHTFANGKNSMAFKPSRGKGGSMRITLIWNQWNEVAPSDYDLYLFNSQGKEIARAQDKNTWLRRPQEIISARLTPGTDYYVGVRSNGKSRGAPFIIDVDGAESVEFPVPTGSLGAPSDAVGSLTVGAVSWRSDTLAAYSSQGPTEDGRIKPEISAPTETYSKVYKGSFGGTSSACPHVSGAAALVWSRFPNYSRDDVAKYLLARAKDLGPAGTDNQYGAGRLDLGEPGDAAAAPTKPVVPTPTTKPTTIPTQPAPTPTTKPVPVVPTPSTPSSGSDIGMMILVFLAMMGMGAMAIVGGFFYILYRIFRKSPAPPVPQGAYHAGGYPGSPPVQPGPAMYHGAQRSPAAPVQPRGYPPGPQHSPQQPGVRPVGPGYTPSPTPGTGSPAKVVPVHPDIAPARGTPPRGVQPPANVQQVVPGKGSSQGKQAAAMHSTVLGAPMADAFTGTPAAAIPSVPVLQIVHGPGAGTEVRLDKPETSIGREPPADIIVAHKSVSFEHARLNFSQGRLYLTDRKSRNGTMVNGQKVDHRELKTGDILTIGPVSYRIQLP